MKKIISWILTGTLVLTGAGSIGAAKAEARGTTLKWTGEVEMGTAWGWSGEAPAEGIVPSVTDEGSTLELNAVEWNDIAIGITVDLTDFIEPHITVVATSTIDGVMNQYAVTNSDYLILYAGETTENGLTSSLLSAETTTISGKLDKEVATYHILAPGRTVTGVYVHEYCRVLTCRNPYSLYFNGQTGEMIGSDLSTEYIDAFGGIEITAEKGDTITLYVKVSGMAVDNVNANIPVPEVNVSGSNNTEATATPIPTDESASSGETTATIPPASVDNTTIVTTPPTSGDVTPTVTVNPDLNDSENDEEEDEDDEDEEEEDEDEEELEEGDTFQKAGFIYTLLNSKSVTVSGYEKNASSLTIGETVTYRSVKYKIVGIDYEAFSDMTTLKKITIGSNVKSIGKSAFSGCKKLKTIHVKTKKIVKVGKNAFKEINPSAKIFIPKKKYGAYKALFRKKGQKSTVRILKGSW